MPSGAWYEEGVRTLYERGLLADTTNFRPRNGMTLAEVVSLAVHIHSIYNNWSIPSGMSELQYALNVGIVTHGQYDNYNDPATRRSFAAILSKALPASAMRGINSVLDGAIPDVPMSDPGAWGIYTLYRAGILWNNNDWQLRPQPAHHPGFRGGDRRPASGPVPAQERQHDRCPARRCLPQPIQPEPLLR